MIRTLTALMLKVALPAAIVGWLFWRIGRDDPQTFQQLAERPKDWPKLVLAGAIEFAAVALTFVRWQILVRALDLPFRLRDAFRLGFLGYLLNFVSFGSVGGDVFKAYFIARRQPQRRTLAVTSVFVDRVVGLYALVVLAAATLLIRGSAQDTPQLAVIRQGTFLFAALGGIGLLLAMIPAVSHGALANAIARWKLVGPIVAQLQRAVELYRQRLGWVVIAALLSVVAHVSVAIALWLASGAIFSAESTPDLAAHFVIVPLAMVAGALPITPAGLGTFEYAMEYLYRHVPLAPAAAGMGIVVSLAYRAMTVIVAAIGLGYYWASHREVMETLHEV